MQAYLDDANIPPQDWYRFISLQDDQQVSTRSLLVERFEREMADFLGVDVVKVLATNSGTSALRLALAHSLSTEIHTSPLTFIGTANAIESVGGVAVFQDVDPETWLMPRREYPGTAVPVDLYGNPCLASGSTLTVLDSCESLGSRTHLSAADYICYSFNGNKTITTGAGGLLVSSTINTQRARHLADPQRGGYNYRMAGLNAALGLIQLARIKEFIRRKKMIHQIYEQELAGIVKLQQPTPGTDPCFWLTAGTFPDGVKIPPLLTKLQEMGVASRRVFRPLTHRGQCPVAWGIYDHGLCFPSSTRNRASTIRWACDKIKEAIGA